MTDGVATGAGGFDEIDPKLTVFALANGVDLSKSESHRRLEWFYDGLERGIVIEPDGKGTLRVVVLSWRSGDEGSGSHRALHEGLTAEALVKLLPSAIDSANEL